MLRESHHHDMSLPVHPVDDAENVLFRFVEEGPDDALWGSLGTIGVLFPPLESEGHSRDEESPLVNLDGLDSGVVLVVQPALLVVRYERVSDGLYVLYGVGAFT